MAEHPDIALLKSDKIGKVLAQGLAELYREKPSFPVDYFAKWLLNYSQQQKNLQQMKVKAQLVSERSAAFQETKQASQALSVEKLKGQEQTIQQKEELKDLIGKTQYHDELLKSTLPEGVFKFIKATSTYIGYYEYPNREIDLLENDDPSGHIDLDANRLITYVGANQDAQDSMLQRQLLEDTGVTYDLFKPQGGEQVDGEAQPEDAGEEDTPNYLYISDVVSNPFVHYFEIPKLGSYMAVPLIVETFLNPDSFDDAVAKLRDYQLRVEEVDLKNKEDLDEYQRRLAEAKENEDFDALEIIKQEYEEFEAEVAMQPEIDAEDKKYVFCVDTVGMDCELTESDRSFVEEIVSHFKTCWEAKELEMIKADAQLYITYENEVDVEAIAESFQVAEDREGQEYEGEVDEGEEYQNAYKRDEAKLSVVREQLINDEESRKHLLALKDYHFIKHHQVLQNAFYLVGFSKEEINLPGTNELNWRKVREELFNEEFLEKVLAYEYKGPKEETVQVYSLINRIKNRLENIDQNAVNSFNLGLGRLLRYIYLLSSARELDIRVRQEDRQRRRQEREDTIAFNKALEVKRAEYLEEERDNAEGEFDEEEVLRQFDEDNSKQEEPEEVQDEVDNDLEAMEEEMEDEAPETN